MTAIYFIQLACQAGCGATFPPSPAADTTAGELRARAEDAGWEVLRHTKGRDLCPHCRIKEIADAVQRAEKGSQSA